MTSLPSRLDISAKIMRYIVSYLRQESGICYDHSNGKDERSQTLMARSDRRIVRTRNLLAQALVALTLEKNYDAVTIREITDRAEIGYATFFRHYPDKDALLL